MKVITLIAFTLLAQPQLGLADPPITIRGGMEKVSLKGSISFLRCAPESGGLEKCKRAPVESKAFEITLVNTGDAPGIMGEQVLKASQDGANFEATVSLAKTVLPGGIFQYKAEIYLDENVDSDTNSFEFIGRTLVLQEISRFNETVWMGKPVSVGGVNITPYVTLSR